MCVIASIPAGTTIDEQELRDMWSTIPDGGGIAFIKDGNIKVKKTMKLKTFLKWFKNIQKEYGSNDMLMHMRIKTHGDVCVQNVHPFNVIQDNQVCNDMVFAHNGILPSVFQTTAKDTDADCIQISDTRRFNELFWSNFDIHALDDPRSIELVEELIGWGNKFVVLNANPAMKHQTYIINAGRGVYKDGVWMSNQNHCPTTYSNHRTIGGFNDEQDLSRTDRDILSEIRQGDATVVPTSRSSYQQTWKTVPSRIDEFEDEDYDAIALGSGLYDPQLLEDSSFIERLANIIEVSGYQTIDDACDGMYFEFDVNGYPVCPDCGNKLDEDEKYDRTCEENCNFYDYRINSDEYYEDMMFEDDITRQETIEAEELARRYEEKVIDHEVTPDVTGQATLWPTE